MGINNIPLKVTRLIEGVQLKTETGLIMNLVYLTSKYLLVWEEKGNLKAESYMKETVLEMINQKKWKILVGKDKVKYYTK
jgi:hypothetical protein